MANTQGNGSSFGPDFYLNSNEQDLLLNALNSNVVPTTTAASSTQPNGRPGSYSAGKAQGANPQRSMSGESPTYASPTQQTPLSGTFANSGIDGSPYPDGELDESNLDWDFNEDLIGGLPGDSGAGDIEGEHGEKRKSPEDGDDQDGNGKRHEHEDKTSKKPGRKPLTSEPTSVSSFLLVKRIRYGWALTVEDRSARRRIARPSVRSASARRSTSKTSKPKLKTSNGRPKPRIARTGAFGRRSNDCRQKSRNTANASPSTRAHTTAARQRFLDRVTLFRRREI